MKRIFGLLLVAVLALTGCSPVEQNARNVLAANYGLLLAAIDQYEAECSADPTGYACTLIVKDAEAQNVGLTALEAYCGFSSASQLTDQCRPVKSAEAALVAALNNITTFETQLKPLLQSKPKPTPVPVPTSKTHNSAGKYDDLWVMEGDVQ